MTGLGKPRPHSKKHIAERREKILNLMSRGYSQFEICKELNISRQTISSDMRYINQQTQKGLFGLAKETLNTMYFSCIEGINQVQREAWKIYKNEDNNPEINQWHRMTALKILRNCNESKFNMYSHGPAFMEIERLEQTVRNMRGNTFDEKGNLIRPLSDKELDDLDKP